MTQNKAIPLTIYCVVMEKDGLPCIELRKRTANIEIIKILVSCAFHGRPVVLMPEFTNKMKALGNMLNMGLIYQDKRSGEYYFK